MIKQTSTINLVIAQSPQGGALQMYYALISTITSMAIGEFQLPLSIRAARNYGVSAQHRWWVVEGCHCISRPGSSALPLTIIISFRLEQHVLIVIVGKASVNRNGLFCI